MRSELDDLVRGDSKYEETEKERGESRMRDDGNNSVVSRKKRDQESRRNLKWFSFTKTKVSFGFKHLQQSLLPSMSGETHGIALSFEKVCGWQVPPFILKDMEKSKNMEMTVQLSLSMFHLNSSTFFGSTWMGPPVSLGGSGSEIPKMVDFEYSEIVYILSRIIDPSCVGVIEIVVSKFDVKRNLVAAQFGCGWTMLNYFSKPFPPDIALGHENVSVTSCAVFAGSPRDLIINTDLKTLARRLKEVEGCSLFLKMYSHRRLLKAQKLIAENEAINRFDIVAGLAPREIVPPGGTRPRMIACIGDEERMDGRTEGGGVYCIPVAPVLAHPMALSLANCQLFVPNRPNFELKLLERMAKDLRAVNKADVQIMSRTLRIGLHNGHTVVGGDWQSHTLLEDTTEEDILLIQDTLISLNGYVPHEMMAIVCMVECKVGIGVAKSSHFDSAAVVNNPSVAAQSAALVRELIYGIAVFIPCDGRRMLLRNTEKSPVGAGALDKDREEEEEDAVDSSGADVELQLSNDLELCAIITPKPVVLDTASGGVIIAGGAGGSKGVAAVGAPADVAAAVSGVVSAIGDTMRSSAQRGGRGESKIVLGFDLRATHPVLGAVHHMDEVSDLLEGHDTLMDTLKGGSTRGLGVGVVGDGENDDDNGEEEGPRKSATIKGSFKIKPSSLLPSFGDRLLSSRGGGDEDDDEDARSVSLSVVTGTSEHSALRLDPLYYGGRDEDEDGGMGDGRDRTGRRRPVFRKDELEDEGDEERREKDNGQFVAPRDRNSLMARSLLTKLATGEGRERERDEGGLLRAAGGVDPDREGLRVAKKTSALPRAIGAHVRELSRAARSRLNRHGFDGAMQDSSLLDGMGHLRLRAGARAERDPVLGRVVDIDLEARDELALHQISIQFAGYRVGMQPKAGSAVESPLSIDLALAPSPKAIYCSFQFYTCLPTRTEVMRLIPADRGQMSVLARAEAYSREETPLALRYMIDCSSSCPTEGHEFAEYLSHCLLHVDVWDADSLMMIGVCSIPVRKLMRQGQPYMKCAIECDVINSDVVAQASGGVTSCVVADGGPVAGSVVGALQIILSNTGEPGSRPLLNAAANPKSSRSAGAAAAAISGGGGSSMGIGDAADPLEGLNWRAYGVMRDVSSAAGFGGKGGIGGGEGRRPKNTVRAKSLSESSPELSRALDDVRQAKDRGSYSMRSLTAARGLEGGNTLTYDEVAILFRRFQGAKRGTVQYTGDLMTLLDLPSMNIALRKLVHTYRSYGGPRDYEREILRYAGADSMLSRRDLEEFLRAVFDRTGVGFRPEELTILANRLFEDKEDQQHEQEQQPQVHGQDGSSITVASVVDFCVKESDRQEWTLLSKRLRAAAERAYMEGEDVEQMLAAKDALGVHYLSLPLFKAFLRELSKYGKFSPKELETCCRHFTKRVAEPMILSRVGSGSNSGAAATAESNVRTDSGPRDGDLSQRPRESVSLREVMAFFGKEYVGNVEVRLQKLIYEHVGQERSPARELITALRGPQHRSNSSSSSRVRMGGQGGGGADAADAATAHTYEEVEAVLGEFGVFSELTHDQVRCVLVRVDSKRIGKISEKRFLQHLGIPFTADDLKISYKDDAHDDSHAAGRSGMNSRAEQEQEVVTAEALLRILMEKVQSNGVAVDSAFRHFDEDGNGTISRSELAEGLSSLTIFEHIPNWRAQIPSLVQKFDTSGDGEVSLKEFFAFLGIANYTPNIIQRMTKIFALATQKNFSIKDIFQEFDSDGSGTIDADELYAGLKKLGTFGEITREDAESIVKHFDRDGDKSTISLDEFLAFFTARVKKERRRRSAAAVAKRFRDVMSAAQDKGLTAEMIFNHFDKNKGGTISDAELAKGLRALPNFQTMSDDDIEDLVAAIDSDASNSISLEEFVAFCGNKPVVSIIQRVQDIFRTAQSKGLAFEEALTVIDKDSDGRLTVQELHRWLTRLPSFKGLQESEGKELFDAIDTDGSGLITVEEFKAFATEGRTIRQRREDLERERREREKEREREQRELDEQARREEEEEEENERERRRRMHAARGGENDDEGQQMDSTHAAELFIRHVHRIAEIDGSVGRLLAFLDEDGDGLISLSEFRSILRREGVFSSTAATRSGPGSSSSSNSGTISEYNFDLLMRPMLRKGKRGKENEEGKAEGEGRRREVGRRGMIRGEDGREEVDKYDVDGDKLDVQELLRFIEGRGREGKGMMITASAHQQRGRRGLGDNDGDDQMAGIEPKEYEFSRDPEIKSLEKKMRQFGRILAKKGVDVEGLFRRYDQHSAGAITRSEFVEILSKMGMYLLEQGKVMDQALYPEHDTRRAQIQQLNRLKGAGGSYLVNAPRMARKLLMNGGNREAGGNFKDHVESMALVNWYRQSQKQMLLQRVLSHSLASEIRLYPRFGKTLFFEHPITNPFGHEERFLIEINDPELRLVTSFDEWLHLRRACRPCVGQLGQEPVEAEMFDQDGLGAVQVVLLPHETLHIPFTFMSLIPHMPDSANMPLLRRRRRANTTTNNNNNMERRGAAGSGGVGVRFDRGEGKDEGGMYEGIGAQRRQQSSSEELKGARYDDRDDDDHHHQHSAEEEELAHRHVDIKIVSGSHGHIVAILRVHILPRPFVVNRIFRFFEPENSIMKKRIQVIGHEPMHFLPGETAVLSKYVHCVEAGEGTGASSAAAPAAARRGGDAQSQSRVVVEWGPGAEETSGAGSLDVLIRYRCAAYPHAGSFYLLVYNDPHQCSLHEIWQVSIQTCRKLDIHGTVGSAVSSDLVLRGDQYARRARAHASVSAFDTVSFQPVGPFQVVPGAYNRVSVTIAARSVGCRRLRVAIVDVDSKELISSWILVFSATAPSIMRSYDVEVQRERPALKKIIFKNPWDVPRRFALVSSDETVMRPRTGVLDVAANGSAYMRLWFNGSQLRDASKAEVLLFLNDSEGGQNEECYLFRLNEAS